jgi:hypothetical protein
MAVGGIAVLARLCELLVKRLLDGQETCRPQPGEWSQGSGARATDQRFMPI